MTLDQKRARAFGVLYPITFVTSIPALIITTVLQMLLDRLDFGMSLPDAIAAPRASQRNSTPTNAEPAFAAEYGTELASCFGQTISSAGITEIAAVTGLECLPDGALEAAAEPIRRGGGDAEVVCPSSRPLPTSAKGLCAATTAG